MFGWKKDNGAADAGVQIGNGADQAVTKEEVLKALEVIIDPDLNKNIVALGFVQNVRVCGGNVAFNIELTTPACPVKDQMKKAAEDVVLGLAGVENVAVEMTAQTRRPPEIKNLIPGIKNAIAVASGKGGVGKSTTAVNLALALAESGAKVGLMDADVYGPSIPIMMGVPEDEQPMAVEENGVQRIIPLERYGIKLISIGFLTEKTNPIVWRGPMVSKMVQTFLGTVEWGELDYLVIDLPPGTGDIQLTLVQSAPLSGAVIVTTPEAVALEDVLRAGRMFEKMAQTGTPVPILGIVENMSYYETPQGERINLFGEGGGERAAREFDVPLLGQVPRQLEITRAGDAGKPVMVAHADSPVAAIYREVAGSVARRVSTISMKETVFRRPAPGSPGVIPVTAS
ncbi:MAG: Mrp/NBP35 family ATP-binding protein [Abitibacteriaceae bacterium]|nr:Mrp/NBP35 family ATP-binding protein [Abditibacteriaceae bacterium]MBV9867143.1 Mrp/NBP35 family ATP-binding protein [Abditibacteriaceae bacterium]